MKKDIEIKLNTMERTINEMKNIVYKMQIKKSDLDEQKGVLASLRNLWS